MKKVISLLMAVVVLTAVFVVPASAATKSDLLTEAAKSPIYKYVKVAIENAARTVEITEEQADQLMPIVKKAVAAVSSDKGPGRYDVDGVHYTKEEYDTIMQCIDEACAILGFTYKLTPKAQNDIIFQVYDANNTLVFSYDGDAVSNTDGAPSSSAVLMLVGSVALLATGIGCFVVSRKRSAVK